MKGRLSEERAQFFQSKNVATEMVDLVSEKPSRWGKYEPAGIVGGYVRRRLEKRR